jgi:uracil-DNA glycosylase
MTTWKDLNFWKTPAWHEVLKTLKAEEGQFVPPIEDVFRPLIETPLDKVRVVILGGEPHSMMANDGLAFSYPRVVQDPGLLPQTLQNIFEEYEHDLRWPTPKSGCLDKWAQYGVLLWNATPTVHKSKPRSHVGIGWHELTNEILTTCYNENPNTVFLLWNTARDHYIDFLPEKALIVDAVGPQIMGKDFDQFFGSSPFTKVNSMLVATGQDPIFWRLP